jgi:hypothetical protein
MASSKKWISTLALACTLGVVATAQPTWRFHLAFEDGTGARDTIWMLYDTTATLGSDPWPGPNVDTLLGEGPLNIDDGAFHVFRTNAIGDTTNTNAYPYSWYPILDGTIINAINWTPPMTITWDTSMFHAPYLPYDQGEFGVATMDGLAFSAYMNNPDFEFGRYDMLISDSLTVSVLTDYLFPFGIYFGPDDHVGLGSIARSPPLAIYPNPARTTLYMRTNGRPDHGTILDLTGQVVRECHNLPDNGAVDIAGLSPGNYLLLMHTPQNQVYHGIFQKVD